MRCPMKPKEPRIDYEIHVSYDADPKDDAEWDFVHTVETLKSAKRCAKQYATERQRPVQVLKTYWHYRWAHPEYEALLRKSCSRWARRPAARDPVGRRSPCSSQASGRRPIGWAAGRACGRVPRGPSLP